MKKIIARAMLLAAALALTAACQTNAGAKSAAQPHNVVIFVADGLRYGSINPQDTPGFAAVRDGGVDFANSHSLYPTVTTVNGSAIATGHYIGDTGNFGNQIFAGDTMRKTDWSRVAGLENDATLKEMNERFGGNYLNEESLLAAARAKGYSVAALGKTGPAAIQDVTRLDTPGGIIIDDNFGGPDGAPPPADLMDAIKAVGISTAQPPRAMPGAPQLQWMTDITAKVLLPRFKAEGKPFAIVIWSPEPDATQHAQQDSKGTLTPGINGPTSMAALKTASEALARIRAALEEQGLAGTTDVFVTADHGFSTVSKESKTSATMAMKFRDFPEGEMPQGFLAIDLTKALNWNLFDTNGLDVALDQGLAPRRGSAMIGPDFEHPHVVIGATGGTDQIWLPESDAATLAPRIVEFLTTQDYTAAIFVNDALGPIPGAVPMSAVGLKGTALTPQPAITVSFRSWSTGCAVPTQCAVEIADTNWRTGGGIHGALHRGDTRNFMAAIGPDFKKRFVNSAPVSNADIAPTMAHILGLDIPAKGALKGRVITEALKGGAKVKTVPGVRRSAPAANGFVTVLDYQSVGAQEYYDAAGAPGRAVGLRTEEERGAIEKARK
jgi:arylsulfatase A-like enzyme